MGSQRRRRPTYGENAETTYQGEHDAIPKEEQATLPPLMTLRPKVNTRNVKVYCVCRMPDHYDRKMIECEECEQWFHYSCMGFSRKAAIPEVWKCGYCTKRQVNIRQKPMETKFPAAKRQRLLY